MKLATPHERFRGIRQWRTEAGILQAWHWCGRTVWSVADWNTDGRFVTRASSRTEARRLLRTLRVGDQVLYYCYTRHGWFPETVVALDRRCDHIRGCPLGVELSNRQRRPYTGVRILSAGGGTL